MRRPAIRSPTRAACFRIRDGRLLQELCRERVGQHLRCRCRRSRAGSRSGEGTVPPSMTVDRPLKLGELLAETVRLYGARLWAAAGIGAFLGGAVLAAGILGELVLVIAVIAPAFTVCYAVAARIALGDPAAEAWAQVGPRAPVLAPLMIIVSLPFVLGIVDALTLCFSVAWLAVVGLAIPVAMIERAPEGTSCFGQIGFALTRATDLARPEFLHVLGVSAALTVIYALFGPFLGILLTGFADNGSLAARVMANGVLGPFFFLGLSLLYFEQRSRALSSPQPKT